MLWIALVDRIGSGLWASVSVLYFTYVTGLSAAQVGTLAAVSGAIGIAGAPSAAASPTACPSPAS
ncbi:hypothetical protein SAV14893_066340 [Streptomyces avermitilis]|uniref:Uncharacterized protein n=1 Tax=Streptomyces avermitilis TaxID=33903 RepID=A0A4D4M5P0_STRAX|nr:hypothetical protein [Streptomyces avermitilis]BBJ55277.1 hypothetical protein SAVMC3_79060 [Streptomyces avermitilis]GDY67241.1 hypothetical protein SAV14893_066340 [Streptomyces avermitilis]